MLGYKDNTNTLCIQLGGENIGELFINKEGQLTFNGDIHKSAQAFAEELKRIFRTSNDNPEGGVTLGTSPALDEGVAGAAPTLINLSMEKREDNFFISYDVEHHNEGDYFHILFDDLHFHYTKERELVIPIESLEKIPNKLTVHITRNDHSMPIRFTPLGVKELHNHLWISQRHWPNPESFSSINLNF